jgi:serine protease
MKSTFTLLLFALTIGVFGQQHETPFVPGEILASIDEGWNAADVAQQLESQFGSSNIKVDKCLSAPADIWKFSFNESVLDPYTVKRAFALHKGVIAAQFNHYVSERETIPNDDLFDNQWHHVNDNDADIDTDLAWDITTGGTTAFGDRIVICVIEGGGASWDHEDLIDNHWVNIYETPNNNIDDDGNGYVDDYNGWDPTDNNDGIPGGNHGTSVSSMAGGVGDNEIGVAGVNWDVELMQVTVGNLTEGNVIEAYTYPLVMRQMYNESAGTEGAFVVVTNASWGIDFGQPSDSPLWCDFYNTLGEAGILNCGATANNNVNIDDVGDLPTGCDSDYMISVTATNNNDVRTFSGYGLTTIDFGAPGESVWMADNGGYGTSSGTSFASPCTAGVIALLYSAPCPSLMALVQGDPQAGADYIRQMLFDGVDPVDNLEGECVTGGRINANNSLQLIMASCSDSECLIPFSVNIEAVDATSYSISWGSIAAMLTFDVRYRETGTADWIDFPDVVNNTLIISGLEWCTEYEVQLLAHCEEEDSEWSQSYVWTTDGCCVAPGIETIALTALGATSVEIEWESILAALSYDVDVSPAGENDWTTYTDVTDIPYEVENLDSCSAYDLRIRTNCDGDQTGWSDIFSFNSIGCGDCADMEYCEVTGVGADEWIAHVEFNTIDNATGTDNGYGDYTDITTALAAGGSYEVTLTPGYAGFAYTEYFKVWIDFNGDGDFDDADELAFDAGSSSVDPVTGTINVPNTVAFGSVRMRVGMDYVGAFGGGSPPDACGELEFGESEDYCINLQETVGLNPVPAPEVLIYPNPANDMLNVQLSLDGVLASLIDSRGRVVQTQMINGNGTMDISSLDAGVYLMTLKGDGIQHQQRIIKQ